MGREYVLWVDGNLWEFITTPSCFLFAEVPDSFGRHFSIVFMTNGNQNDGGYLKLFLASSVENETRVHIEIPELGRGEDRVIPGKPSGGTSVCMSVREMAGQKQTLSLIGHKL